MWGAVRWSLGAVRNYVRLARAAANVEHEALDSNVYSFVLMRHPNEPAVSMFRTDGTTGGELFGGANDADYLDDVGEGGDGDDEDEDEDEEDDDIAGLNDMLDED